MAKPINRTNAPRTCLWCGARLLQQYRYTYGREQAAVNAKPERQPTGHYGRYGDDYFCGLNCGRRFGVALAKAGKRLAPYAE